MVDDKSKSPREGDVNPLETLAAASALGITVATQAMGFWLSVMSGLTTAAREAKARADESAGEAKPAPKAKPAETEPRPSAEIVPLKPKVEKPAAKPEAKTVVEAPVSKPEPVAAAAPETAPEPEVEAVKEAPTVAATIVAPIAPEPVKAAAPKKAAPNPAAPKKTKPAKVESKPTPVEAKPAEVKTVAPAPSQLKLMPEEFRRPKALDKPEQPDDLKKIKGLGPKLEVTLNGLGIWTLAQVAALEPAEVAWLDDYLGLSGRIARDGWIDAAKAGGTHG
jgi:predicted flap endonuclease-1-like 5' DNA nuclease